MSALDTFMWIAIFLAIYAPLVIASYFVDKFLWKRFNKGLFPKGYFK